MKRSVQITKGVFDRITGLFILMIFSPLMIVFGVMIKLTSPGPILYRQRRVGILTDKDGLKEFTLLKFRTMKIDEKKPHESMITAKDDPRVTTVGKLLRKTRLDELPQLFNVLKGEMSLIGPRPEQLERLTLLSSAIPFFEERMRDVKPGITGLAQVKLAYTGTFDAQTKLRKYRDVLINPFELEGVGETEADAVRIKMLYDFAYMMAMENFWEFLRTDLSIFFKTPVVMFWKRNGV